MYTLTEIAAMMQARLTGDGNLKKAWQLSIDSRTVSDAGNTIFFAITTSHNDGHQYINELIEKGVKVFVVNKAFQIPDKNNICFLSVEHTGIALQQLAAGHRRHFNIPVIGITGSNGKTIVKEWLLQLMRHRYSICASPKSFNSQLGVPLSVWQLHEDHQLGIFEAGISMPGEMDALANIIQPEIGILTHLGTAHDEGFDTFENKVQEKLKLFKDSKVVLMHFNPELVKQLGSKAITYDFNNTKADLNITAITTNAGSRILKGVYKGEESSIEIPFTDEASIENAGIVWLATLHLNAFRQQAFSELQAISMRLELKQAINNCLLINDSYSNDIHALGAALSFLKRQTIHGKATVILSDIEQSGMSEEEQCRQVNTLLHNNHINRFYGIGPVFSKHQQLFTGTYSSRFFATTNDFIQQFNGTEFENESILLKGARHYSFEHIATKLEKQSHGTVLEINLTAAAANLSYIRSLLDKNMKVMAMVKAFAYGSGSYEIAKMLDGKVNYMAVAYTDEGVTLRQNGIKTPIMVMNADGETYGHLFRYGLEPVVFSINQLEQLYLFAEGRPLAVHIEIDTGMHRLGFSPSETAALTEWFIGKDNFRIQSVFSHLSASDEAIYDDFTKQQFELFDLVVKQLQAGIPYNFLKHISNTAGALRFDQNGFNMIRLGIGLYGIDPSGEHQKMLKNVFTLKTVVSQIKWIGANESVGYARKAIDDHERRIAVLAIGYADGLNRHLSNGNGGFMIGGKYAPILGNVCMDMCMVDVTGITCNEGDEAELFGADADIIELAKKLGTIPYEILTGISQRIKRVYISE
ncbi:MAG: bifunctional UDP-N-acetylmuramoyl-tripeptide:D-alanyl-D-alanine ligase/alanine racemase [Bacteroidota bacterium]